MFVTNYYFYTYQTFLFTVIIRLVCVTARRVVYEEQLENDIEFTSPNIDQYMFMVLYLFVFVLTIFCLQIYNDIKCSGHLWQLWSG